MAEVPYAFAEEDNPYAADDDAFAKGLAAFKEGRLVDAVRAFEAVVQREPAHSPSERSWNTPEDIACMHRCMSHTAMAYATGISHCR